MTTGVTALDLAQEVVGDGVTVVSANFSGVQQQAATFSGALDPATGLVGVVNYDSGIILTSGYATDIVGNNESAGTTRNLTSGGDPALDALNPGGQLTQDAAILEIDFIPTQSEITLQYVFGSEEYPEYVYSNFNDTWAIFVNGVNIAVAPNNLPLGINTVNDASHFTPTNGNDINDPNPGHNPNDGIFESSHESLYINNAVVTAGNTSAYNTQMDGFTVTMSVLANVNANQVNTIRIALADTGDGAYDSWLLLRGDSLQTSPIARPDVVAPDPVLGTTIDVLANDDDPVLIAPGDQPLSITEINGAAISAGGTSTLSSGATVTLNNDGTLHVTAPTNGASGDAFTYTIFDGQNTSTGVVTIANTVNDAPVISAPATQAANQDDTTSISGFSLYDIDAGYEDVNATISVTNGTIGITGFAGLTVTDNGTGTVQLTGPVIQIQNALNSIIYTPNSGYTGNDILNITVDDLGNTGTGGALQDTAAVAITVSDLSFIPKINLDPTNISGGADDRGYEATFSAASATPVALTAPGISLADSDSTDMQSATISILSVPDGNNERLTIGGTTFQLATTQTSTITLSGTTFSVAYSAGTRVFTITESGSSTMPNAALEALFASSTYANIAGTPATSDRFFSFAVSDGTNPSNVALSTINVQIENPPTLDLDSTDAQPSSFTVTYEPNAAPVAIASANTLITDPDSTNMLSATITLTNHQTGDALSLLGALPAGISATAYSSATGQITLSGLATIAEYQTAIEQIGYASTSSNPADRTISVTVSDGGLSSNIAISTIDVRTPPTATPSTSSGAEDAATIAVDLAGTDPDGTVDFVTVTTLPPVSEGVLYLADGTTPIVAGTPITAAQAATLVFTPTANFNGTVTVPFTVTDNHGSISTSANEVITVTPVIDLPTAIPSTSSGAEDAPTISVDLTGTDPDGTVDFVTITTLPLVSEGVLFLADGTTPVLAGTPVTAAQAATLVFTPAVNFNGTVTIPFIVTDNDGNVSAAAANEVITVTPVIDLPTATPSTSSGVEDAPTIAVDLAGIDPDGTVDFVTITTLPPVSEGVLYLADGTTAVVAGTPITAAQAATFVFTPATNFNGTVTIPFTVTDNDGNVSASANEVITVTPVIDLPTATPSTSSGAEDAPTIAVDLAGTDPDGTVDFVTIMTLPPVGEGILYLADGTTPVVAGTPVTAAQAATLVFTPAANFNGTVTIPFTVTDNDGNVSASAANEVITVTPVIDLPTATPSTSSGTEDAPTIAVDLAGTDPDGTVDFVTITTLPPVSEGVLYLADGTTPLVAGTPITAAQAATLVFTPAANFNGTVMIPFTVTDNDGNVSVSAANEVITVTPVIDLPTATPSTSSGAEDAPTIAVDLTGTDPDGTVDFVTITTLPPVSEGVLYLADGTTPVVAGTPITAAQAATLVFTPAANFNGTVTIPFTVTDNDGNVSASANEVITVTPAIDLPTATPSTSSGAEDAATIPVDLTGTDPDGTVDFVTITTLPPVSEGVLYFTNGTTPVVAGTPVTAAQAATLVFTPAANFNGTVTIPFTVTDNDGNVSASPANEVITVAPIIDLPTATSSTSSGNEDAPAISVDLTGTDPDGTVDFVTVTTLPPVNEGVLFLADGVTPVVAGTPVTAAQAATFVFTPATNFNGTVTIPFTVTDNDGNVSASANEVITVTPVIDLPTATPSTSSGAEDAPTIAVDLAGTDPDGTVDFVTITTLPPVSEGVLYLADGTTPVVVAGTPVTAAQAATLVFTPAVNFNGTVTIPFTVTDNDGNVSASTASEVITVTPGIDLPTATPSTSNGAEDAPTIAVDLTGTDPDGTVDFVTITTLPPVSEGVLYLADGTTPVVAGTPVTAAQAATLVFTPAANFNGTVTIPFTVTDNDGNVSASTANEVITVTPVIDLPTATPSTSNGAEDAPTIAVDLAGTDPDGTVDFVTITTLPPVSEGVLYLADGTTPLVAGTPITAAQAATLVFTPAANFNGTVTIPFTVTDNDGNVSASPANEVITITPVIDPPTATPSTSVGNEDDPSVTINLGGTDPGGTVDFVTVTALPPTTEGTLYLADGTTPVVAGTPVTAAQAATLVFTPAINFNGTITIPFAVTDNDGNNSPPANETITIVAINDAPVASDDIAQTEAEQHVIINALANDLDVDGDPISVVSATSPNGIVNINSDGTLTFQPASGYSGIGVINYTVSDGNGGVHSATINVDVRATSHITIQPTAPTDPFVTQSTSEPLHVDGALLDAITGVRSLNGISNELTEHGIVTAAANQVSSLNGIAASDAVGTSERPQPLSDERAWAIVQALNDTGYQGSANSWDAHALTGFSLRMNLLGSETGSSSSAQIIIESLVRDQTLIIQITNSVPDATKSVQEYRISQANGQPLPNWLDRAGKSLVIGQRPPNIDRLDLSVTVIYTDGSFEEKAVQIDTKSGDIKLLELKQEANLNRTFSEQFTVKSPATEQEVTDLAEILKR
jgi:hypothetical protein